MSEVGMGEIRSEVLIRLGTLIRLRWYAIAGQITAILLIGFGFGFPMPWQLCFVLVAFSAALNLILLKRRRRDHHLSGNGVFFLLGFDILQLATLIYLTGGLQNPFAIMLLAPVIVSSTSLHLNHTLILGGLAIVFVSGLAVYHLPLPWYPEHPIEFPLVLVAGTWAAIVCTLGFTAIYAFRVAEETRKLGNALAATELVLLREQHLSALDGLAAAAAHELGTPLATIALISKEIANEVPKEGGLFEDATLLRSQAERCRKILQKLSTYSNDSEGIDHTISFIGMIEEEVAPLRHRGVTIEIQDDGDQSKLPSLKRNPGIHYGLGNLLDNAVSFARSKVLIILDWDENNVTINIVDDGDGFPEAILGQIGQPFIPSQSWAKGSFRHGLGLGLFIAKTLLERSGAELNFGNGNGSNKNLSGAHIHIGWPRDRLLSNHLSERQEPI